jgi:hypothetical protein
LFIEFEENEHFLGLMSSRSSLRDGGGGGGMLAMGEYVLLKLRSKYACWLLELASLREERMLEGSLLQGWNG